MMSCSHASLQPNRKLAGWLLTTAVMTNFGCVSQQTYDRLTLESTKLQQAVEVTRTEVAELDKQILALDTTKQQHTTAIAKLRTAIQQEKSRLPIMRQRAGNKLTILQAQVAHLARQQQQLARQITSMREARSSLQAQADQYKREVEEAQSGLTTTSSPIEAAADPHTIIAPPPSPPLSPPSTVTPTETAPPPQVAQVNPAPEKPASPKPPAPVRAAKVEPPPVDDSWTGMITGWFTTAWSWLFD